MAKIQSVTLTADGSTDTLEAVSRFTVLAGSTGGTNFGGGTLSIEVSHDGINYTSTQAITEEGAYTSEDYVGGVYLKLTLLGATSPDLDCSIKYE